MIRLNLPRAPYWLDLPLGVRLRVRPVDTAVDAAARFAAVETLRAEPEAASPARRLGLAKRRRWPPPPPKTKGILG